MFSFSYKAIRSRCKNGWVQFFKKVFCKTYHTYEKFDRADVLEKYAYG